MTVDIEDTIAAIASANGCGLRGIVRLTGPHTVRCVSELFGVQVTSETPSQSDVQLNLMEDLQLPGRLLLWPTTQSYTRQPSAEFHTLGTKPLLDMALEKICAAGCRIARPGEFTLRAFLGGRLDLTQAEAVLAVIDSTGQQQFDVALQQLAGGLANPLNQIREQLIDILAELEAGLDFVEEDIEFISRERMLESLQACIESVSELETQLGSRDSSDSVFRVALVGWPNVGKSSLFNALLNRPEAIVANVAGTTRDYVSANTEKSGLQIQLIDTAGLDSVVTELDVSVGELAEVITEPLDVSIDTAAQQASIEQLRNADLKVLCLDSNRNLNELETQLLQVLAAESTVVALTKCDLDLQIRFDGDYVLTSSIPGNLKGIQGLWDEISDRLTGLNGADKSVVGSTMSRCREHVGQVLLGLHAANDAAISSFGEEIIAAEIRHSLEQLGQIVGTVYTDDILDRIFGRFCIGK